MQVPAIAIGNKHQGSIHLYGYMIFAVVAVVVAAFVVMVVQWSGYCMMNSVTCGTTATFVDGESLL